MAAQQDADLQRLLKQHQQLLQTMSTISKQLHDTALSIVRNIRG